MTVDGARILLCTCEGSVPIDAKAIAAALGGVSPVVHRHLCRSEFDRFQAGAAHGRVLVGCTQEAPLFRQAAERIAADLRFVNLRETAGWSDDATAAAPKMAALIAEAALDLASPAAVTLTSQGRVLLCGDGQGTLEAAVRLTAQGCAVTCVLGTAAEVLPPATRDFILARGVIRQAQGHLGAFAVTVGDFAPASASCRNSLTFERPAGSVRLDFDVILDLSRGQPLFPAVARRDGYLRVDPGSPVAVERALLDAVALIGEFEKPRHVRLEPSLCAHARNNLVGCTRCLDACPSGALSVAGDHVAVAAELCCGHGACAALCPTGALRYDVPAGNGLFECLRVLLATYRTAAPSRAPVLLLHDPRHGAEMIGLTARLGPGLPAHVLPVVVNEITAVGSDVLLTALAHGAAGIVILAAAEHRGALAPLTEAAILVEAITTGLGLVGGRVTIVDSADPADLGALLRRPAPPALARPAEYLVLGRKRDTLWLALRHLHGAAPVPVEVLPLAAGAPMGAVDLELDRCTLCMSCTVACPTGALSANPETPQLGFTETSCVQCGLCRVTCPEKAITLTPRVDFRDDARRRRILKEEEPACCTRCGKPFGIRSSIEHMITKLAGHSMFQQPGRLDLLRMCEDCRVLAQFGDELASAGQRRIPRSTDDYLRDRN